MSRVHTMKQGKKKKLVDK